MSYLKDEMDRRNIVEESQARKFRDILDARPQEVKDRAYLAQYIMHLQEVGEARARANATPEQREFQAKCQREFTEFLSVSDSVFPGRSKVIDVVVTRSSTAMTVYSDIRGPIVKTIAAPKDKGGVRMYSDVQSQLGVPDKEIRYQGYCILPDKNRVSKYIFASVTRRQYNGLPRAFGVFDIGEAIYSGFYRDEDGIFHEIIDQSFMDNDTELGSNEFYADLEKEYNKQLAIIRNLPQNESEENSL